MFILFLIGSCCRDPRLCSDVSATAPSKGKQSINKCICTEHNCFLLADDLPTKINPTCFKTLTQQSTFIISRAATGAFQQPPVTGWWVPKIDTSVCSCGYSLCAACVDSVLYKKNAIKKYINHIILKSIICCDYDQFLLDLHVSGYGGSHIQTQQRAPTAGSCSKQNVQSRPFSLQQNPK